MRYITPLTLIALVVLLAACGGAGPTVTSPSPVSQATVVPDQPSQAPEPTQAPQSTEPVKPGPGGETAQPAGQGILITLQKSGGIAGITQLLTVYSDGRIEQSGTGGTKSTQVAPADIEVLQKLLASPEFAAVPPISRATGADLFTYTLTVMDSGSQRTIVTMDGVENPAVLSQVLGELNKLEAQVK